MSELSLVLIRFGYLAVLWIFVLATISVIRTDMFGARAARTAGGQERKAAKPTRSKPAKPRKGDPTSVAILEGGNAGEVVSLANAPLLIGRGNDAAIRLDDDYVSTRHARIAVSGDQWYVEDLGSTNGTYVGSSRITQATAISLGTQIRIGKTILEMRK
ncbi:FHA domain-containing protein FhaB/FipA [Nocardioides marmorisolisilvae]|uniref:FHA domain-containing protein n=1 Tax=Nocardioides marmorisolisilvae TaxID=1542737 RepID=A0A3N0DI36_9ACTN|nr:FHA domain-containing protein [Nocardioides marmorisolisilvae]RNL75340.1 FHA domain-containing protein [Nocardioides marmorisolisilvae]